MYHNRFFYTMRTQSHFNTAITLIKRYKGKEPLVHYLQSYFAGEKKHGSRDRKQISHLCYAYFRMGHTLASIETADRLKIAIFLCQDNPAGWDEFLADEWKEWPGNLSERIALVQKQYPLFEVQEIFPWKEELSPAIEPIHFAASHLVQPRLFLRVRPGKLQKVTSLLQQTELIFKQYDEHCLALPNGSRINELLDLNADVVVQDRSSQQIASFIQLMQLQGGARIWDCCAASGGKSILAADTLQDIKLLVSDVRASILQNLKQRFEKAGIKNYQLREADLRVPIAGSLIAPPDAIICDAPCTGSGTWGRTTEQLAFFDPEKIVDYAALQQTIIRNTLPHLKKYGYFLYITCSVFRQENEEAVAYIQREFKDLRLVQAASVTGYEHQADSMFAALFKKEG